jgi:membrane fusion protein, multidrug efflux system
VKSAIKHTAAAGGYLYWDYAEHFETTDDAFIAARQFAIAPKVPGYLTAVPVTDNQHVPVRGVIARIDERDYRIALEQAQAQVASAEVSVQNAQPAPTRHRRTKRRRRLVFAKQQAVRYQWLDQKGAGTLSERIAVFDSVTYWHT